MHGFGGSPMHLQWVEVECSLGSLMYLMSKCKIVLLKQFFHKLSKFFFFEVIWNFFFVVLIYTYDQTPSL
jgi:hypothetical protein